MNYEIYKIATSSQNSVGSLDDWELVASGSITGASAVQTNMLKQKAAIVLIY